MRYRGIANILFAAAIVLALTACLGTTTQQTLVPGAQTATSTTTSTRSTTIVIPSPAITSAATTTTPIVTASTPPSSATSTASAAMVSEGQQIFQTGIGPDGQRIQRSNTSLGGMMGGGMMGSAGCASCHGPLGQGEQTPMFSAPNITYGNLTDPQGMIEPDGSRGPTYTDAQIKQAVESGIGADGDQLDTTMPRWQMTDSEFSALLAYLKTLP